MNVYFLNFDTIELVCITFFFKKRELIFSLLSYIKTVVI